MKIAAVYGLLAWLALQQPIRLYLNHRQTPANAAPEEGSHV